MCQLLSSLLRSDKTVSERKVVLAHGSDDAVVRPSVVAGKAGSGGCSHALLQITRQIMGSVHVHLAVSFPLFFQPRTAAHGMYHPYSMWVFPFLLVFGNTIADTLRAEYH